MSCPFCELLKTKERPFIFETTHWFAFTPIGPVNEGHLLIVPKRHVDRLEQLRAEEWMNLYTAIQFLTTQDYNIGVNAGTVAGQTVPHLHIHLIPREEGDVEDVKGGIVGALGEKIEGSKMKDYLEGLKNEES